MYTKSQLDLIFKYYIQIVKINMILMDIPFHCNRLNISDRTFFTLMLDKYKEVLFIKLASITSLSFEAIGSYLNEKEYCLVFELELFFDTDYTYLFILYSNVYMCYTRYVELYDIQQEYPLANEVMTTFVKSAIKYAHPIYFNLAASYVDEYLSIQEVVDLIHVVSCAVNSIYSNTHVAIIEGMPISINKI